MATTLGNTLIDDDHHDTMCNDDDDYDDNDDYDDDTLGRALATKTKATTSAHSNTLINDHEYGDHDNTG